MAITTAVCDSFKADLIAMTPHTAADVYKIALYTSTATLGASTTAYSATNEVSGSGYTAGGATATVTVTLSRRVAAVSTRCR